MFVGDVIVIAHDAVLLEAAVEEEVIFFLGHAVIQHIFVHLRIETASVIEIERQEALRVHQLCRPDRRRALGMKIFR